MRINFMNKICKRGKSKAQSLVEYGLILALVSVVAITVLQTMGTQIKKTVNGLTGNLTQANLANACTSTNGAWDAGTSTCDCKHAGPIDANGVGTALTLNTDARSADFGKCQ